MSAKKMTTKDLKKSKRTLQYLCTIMIREQIEIVLAKNYDSLSYNELLKQYGQLRDYARVALMQAKSLGVKLKEKDEYIEKLFDLKKKEIEGFTKEISKLKLKNQEVISENTIMRKKKHTLISDNILPINNDLLVNESEIAYHEVIGEGASSIVYKATYRGINVAVKKLSIEGTNPTNAIIEKITNEIKIMSLAHHPNIVLVMGYVVEKPKKFCIITEYMPFKSLSTVLKGTTPLTFLQSLNVGLQIAQAMNYLHSYNPPILHRDLKSGNILLDQYFRAKICDFGIAKIAPFQPTETKTIGTFQYMSPEVLSNGIYSKKSDVYAYGIILWELFTRKEPFSKLQPIQIIFAVINDDKRPTVPPNCPQDYLMLLKDCWAKDPEKRPTFGDIQMRVQSMIDKCKDSI